MFSFLSNFTEELKKAREIRDERAANPMAENARDYDPDAFREYEYYDKKTGRFITKREAEQIYEEHVLPEASAYELVSDPDVYFDERFRKIEDEDRVEFATRVRQEKLDEGLLTSISDSQDAYRDAYGNIQMSDYAQENLDTANTRLNEIYKSLRGDIGSQRQGAEMFLPYATGEQSVVREQSRVEGDRIRRATGSGLATNIGAAGGNSTAALIANSLSGEQQALGDLGAQAGINAAKERYDSMLGYNEALGGVTAASQEFYDINAAQQQNAMLLGAQDIAAQRDSEAALLGQTMQGIHAGYTSQSMLVAAELAREMEDAQAASFLESMGMKLANAGIDMVASGGSEALGAVAQSLAPLRKA